MFLVTQSSFAQNVTFEATAQQNVAVGDQFLVRFTVNAQGDNFRGPEFKDFRILSGPNTSTNSSFSNINGKMSQSLTVTYTYYLRATVEGQFTVGSASIEVNGEKYETKPITVKVAKERQRQSTGGSQQQNNATQAELQANDIFLRAVVDNKSPFVGEQVMVTYKIYTKVPISQLQVSKQSTFSGFWMKNLMDQNTGLEQQTEVIDGEEYISAVLSKYALFPQKSGKIIIEPMELQCVAQLRRNNRQRNRDFFNSIFDDPFFSGYRNIQSFEESNALEINVKPLPTANKPLDFSGAVGNFKLQSNLDKTEVKTNDAITLKVMISGEGNLELIDKLELNFPPDFEAYEPKIADDIRQTAGAGVFGSRTFEYLLIPRNPGTFNIKEVVFNYFDTKSNSYETLSTQAFEITVEKGEDYQAGVTFSGGSQEDIQYIGSDIRHIQTKDIKLSRIGYYFVRTTSFILWIIIPIVLFVLIVIYWRKQVERLSNQTLMRHRKATKVARKNLKQAQQFLGTKNTSEFYNEISQALWGYLSDKFSIPLAELSRESVHEALENKDIKEESIAQFIETLDHTDYARFAPGDPSQTMDKIYLEALEIISKIERELR